MMGRPDARAPKSWTTPHSRAAHIPSMRDGHTTTGSSRLRGKAAFCSPFTLRTLVCATTAVCALPSSMASVTNVRFSRQRCASTPIGFDPIIQSLGASRQLGPVRGRALICFRLDNRLPLEHGKAHVTARNQKRLARKSSCALVRPHNDDAQLGNARGVRAGARVRFGII
jgi:hypothetical protein